MAFPLLRGVVQLLQYSADESKKKRQRTTERWNVVELLREVVWPKPVLISYMFVFSSDLIR